MDFYMENPKILEEKHNERDWERACNMTLYDFISSAYDIDMKEFGIHVILFEWGDNEFYQFFQKT